MPTDYGLQPATATNDYGLEQASPASSPNGPTIGPRTPSKTAAIFAAGGASGIYNAIQTLGDWANATQEGKEQHPIQAKVGKFVDEIKGMLVGTSNKENAIGSGKYGMLNNPVTSMVMGAPEDEAINLARNVVTHPIQTAKAAVKAIGSIGKEVAPAAEEVAPIAAVKAIGSIGKEVAPAAEEVAPIATAPGASTQNPTVAQLRGAGTTGGPVTESITQNDVLQYAADKGIKLTPAQRTLEEAKKSEQALGEEAFGTGSLIKEAVNKEKSKVGEAVEALQDKVDPGIVGTSPGAAGEHLQKAATDAKTALKKSVDNAYDSVDAQGVNLAGNIQDPINRFLYDMQNKVNPQLGISRPVTQTAGAKSALEDIEKLMTDPGLQGDTPVENMRNLRTTLLEKGNDYGVNALSSSGQRIYKLAASKVDQAIMDAAKDTDFESTFRAAGQQNAKLQELYNDSGSPLYRILNEDDPEKVVNSILSRKSAHDVGILKGEGIDVGPLARQVVEDVKNGGFRVTKRGLGGYPDSFLQSVLGPDGTKELYTQAEISRRLNENYNPSRSGRLVLGAAQSVHPVIGTVFSQGARLRSMPEDVAPFVAPSATSPITGGGLASPEELFNKASNQ